ncbi:MAG: AAA family ATPase [Akkermansiaceae bacterium]|nr:AAA family ATPase [Akkermansiaceae bacterium]
MDHIPFLIVFALGIAAAFWVGRNTSPKKPSPVPQPAPIPGNETEEEQPTPGQKEKKSKEKKPKDIHAWAQKLGNDLGKIPTSIGIIEHPKFQRALTELAAREISAEDLVVHLKSENDFMAMLALHLAGDRDDLDEEILKPALFSHIRNPSTHRTITALRCIPSIYKQPAIGPVFAAVYSPWDDFQIDRALRKFVAERLAFGEELTFGEHNREIDSWDLDDVKTIVRRLPDEQARVLLDELEEKGIGEPGDPREFLRQFATILGPISDQLEDGSPILETATLEARKKSIVESLTRDEQPRSVLLTGASRVGKTSLTRLVARDLQEQGFIVVTATSANLQSGQSYIGQLEQRMREFLRILRRRKVVWIADSFHELELAGRHQYSPTSILDMILPDLSEGNILVIGETPESSLSKLKTSSPRIDTAVDIVKIDEPGEKQALEMAGDWINDHPGQLGKRPGSTSETLAEGLKLARQYSLDHAMPGLLLDLLKECFQRECDQAKGPSVSIDRPALLRALASRTGMPMEIIDDELILDLKALQKKFDHSVLGQPEAVTALVERIAMIKAGLTDPSRPLGVFLFAGPTGTGKTEIAKSLANFLFGSEQRMIRLDMSEFQDSSSLTRLIGSPDEGTSLASRIRQQPFSLVLLDEFEKANRNVWDLFLQVFDDGRLTDSRGNTADLRNTIIILTSNLGARDAQAVSMGFNQSNHPSYQPREIQKAIEQTFRKEFVNRIDRIVTFRPLSRDTMREILRHQLSKTLSRRGLRNRPWVIEWDETASELLLEKGFTPTMGARPLMRAMDRYLLGPLAKEIVNGVIPPEEQLLFIYARDGELHWDSSLDESADNLAADPEEEVAEFSNRHLILNPTGSEDELRHLCQRHQDLDELLNLEAYLEAKQACLEAMQREGFWQSEERWHHLALAEYIDRVESALNATGSLLERLVNNPDSRPSSPEKVRLLVSKQAERLFLLEQSYPEITAGEANDALLLIEANANDISFAEQLRTMYQSWAASRGMNLQEIRSPMYWAARMNGFGALTILQAEAGVHHWAEGKKGDRWQCKVHVIPIAPGEKSIRFDQLPKLSGTTRRYQEVPTPLVIDKKRPFRTGRLDLVLKGHFDLIEPN